MSSRLLDSQPYVCNVLFSSRRIGQKRLLKSMALFISFQGGDAVLWLGRLAGAEPDLHQGHRQAGPQRPVEWGRCCDGELFHTDPSTMSTFHSLLPFAVLIEI